ncbi:tripartite tricarboxylate transporter TctB family protein [Arthrobacter sp. Br18]|uniref:tripartite tricarboxylate transporter TctB family protein n=1 Tax=Arthrobacter sp. Br18 TaxID=1312954 RepID=UPI00047A2EE2|nr:tripartite tricarboxylate transporter TctB family protein [Arthrobacter sp. Br18]
MGNIIGGFVVLIFCFIFWIQRDYTSDYGGLFPDVVMVVLAALSVMLIARGVLWRHESGWDTTGRLNYRDLGRALILLIAWVISLPVLGYLVGGILFFTLVAVMMRTERPTLKNLALDLGVAVAVVGVFYLGFTQVLYVTLPEVSL